MGMEMISISVAGSIPTRGQHFAEINLPFIMKQYKNMYYSKTLFEISGSPISGARRAAF